MSRALGIAALAAAALLGLAGCASTPGQTTELANVLGRDLTEAHRANRALAVQYFGRMRADVNQFVDEHYRPFVIRESLQRFRLLDRIAPAAQPGAGRSEADAALRALRVYLEEVSAAIESYRADRLRDLEAQETRAVSAIDLAYARMQSANTVLTAHLMSVRQVEDAQTDLLRRADVLDLRDQVLGAAVHLSDGIARVVAQARREQPQDLTKTAEAMAALISAEPPVPTSRTGAGTAGAARAAPPAVSTSGPAPRP
jgi:hypothetical protein